MRWVSAHKRAKVTRFCLARQQDRREDGLELLVPMAAVTPRSQGSPAVLNMTFTIPQWAGCLPEATCQCHLIPNLDLGTERNLRDRDQSERYTWLRLRINLEEITKMPFPGLQPGPSLVGVTRQKLRNQFSLPTVRLILKVSPAKAPAPRVHCASGGG